MEYCPHCKGTGIAIVLLDDTEDLGIQRCDSCVQLTDSQAVFKVTELIKTLETKE